MGAGGDGAKRASYQAIRRRMIGETELALMIGLRFPDRVRRIPTMEVGTGRFHPRFARQFWSETLGVDLDEFSSLFPGPADDYYDPTA